MAREIAEIPALAEGLLAQGDADRRNRQTDR